MRKEYEEMQQTCQTGFLCYIIESGNKCSLARQLRAGVNLIATERCRPEHPLPVWQQPARAARYFLRCPHARRHPDRSHPSLPF
jgi:hypothetical protein